MEGPSKAEISFEDRKDGSCGVAYVVQEPGKSGDGGPPGPGGEGGGLNVTCCISSLMSTCRVTVEDLSEALLLI